MWVNHVHLFVRDLDRAVTFYREVLGLEVTPTPEANMASVRAGESFGLDLDLHPELSADEAKPIIVGFLVQSADETFAGLKARGLPLEGAPQDQYWGVRNFYFKDPDGYTIECAQPLAPPGSEAGDSQA